MLPARRVAAVIRFAPPAEAGGRDPAQTRPHCAAVKQASGVLKPIALDCRGEETFFDAFAYL